MGSIREANMNDFSKYQFRIFLELFSIHSCAHLCGTFLIGFACY